MSFVKRGIRIILHLVILLLFFDILFAGFAQVDPQNLSTNLLTDIYENANDVAQNTLDSSFDRLCQPQVQEKQLDVAVECARIDELKEVCANKELYEPSTELDEACIVIESGEFERSCQVVLEIDMNISVNNDNCDALNSGEMSHKDFFINYTLEASSSLETNSSTGQLNSFLSNPWFSSDFQTILFKFLFMMVLLTAMYFLFGQLIFITELQKLFFSVPLMILLTTVIVYGFQYIVEPDTSALLQGTAQPGEIIMTLLPLAFSQFITVELFILAGVCLFFWILITLLIYLKKSRESQQMPL